MPTQFQFSIENNFAAGHVTDFTGLNFPPNALFDTQNCEINDDGSINRRLGFDFETNYSTKTISRTNNVVTSYLWKNVSGNGDVSVLVKQVGSTVYFYRTEGDAFSLGAIADTVALTPVAGAPDSNTVEAQFSDGNGLLFITHPYCEPMRVAYNTSTDAVTETNISVKLRDFQGDTVDANAVDNRPTATLAGLNVNHKYNLYNQGWTTANLTLWDTAQTTMPSNADVMWRFKDATDNFDASTASIARITAGNTPAPTGHFVLNVFNQDRDTASGLSGATATTSSFYRPSTSAFFAGRVFYAGTPYIGFDSNIYFSQIVERTDQYGYCYQENDPTSEDLFDLLPSDGGVISIPEAGTILKLVSVPGGLCVFTTKGVWFVTGSTGLGFTAVDYTVQKLSSFKALSASSFVDVAGYPAWWNEEGIYTLQPGQVANQTLPSVNSLTHKKFSQFFADIPLSSKSHAKGVYHYADFQIRWVYKSEETAQITNLYEYDRVLNFNTLTGAFYTWTISNSDVKVNGIVLSDITSGSISADTVVAGVDTVIDGSGNTVISFTQTGLETSAFDKYIVSYADAGSHKFTFSDKINSDYLDWFTYNLVGVNYDSYFITGNKLYGGGLRRTQNNYVRVFSKTDEAVAYNFQGIWDYALTSSGTGRWSTSQLVQHTDLNYGSSFKKLKVRGHGACMQIRVSSAEGQPFHLLGWSGLETINKLP